jgi:predicted MFS family arabinose efflux permease
MLVRCIQPVLDDYPLPLSGPEFRMSQGGIALFALAGVAGAVTAPVAGRVADRGWTHHATVFAMLSVAGSFLLTHLAPVGSTLSLGLLVIAAILLDFGVSANMTLGQRAIFALGAEFRSRLKGLYMATFFVGGAVGSAVGGGLMPKVAGRSLRGSDSLCPLSHYSIHYPNARLSSPYRGYESR